jgi:dihydroorotase
MMTLYFAGMSQDRSVQAAQSSSVTRYIKFYPNPATTYINIELQRAMQKNSSFQVYNFLGKKVIELQDVATKTRIDLSTYSRGIYIYQLKDKSGKIIESGKFQIER